MLSLVASVSPRLATETDYSSKEVHISDIFSKWRPILSLASVLCFFLVHQGFSMGQEEETPRYTLDPVVVTAGRIPEHLSRTGQSVSILTREDIEVLPADNIADLLKTVSGVDMRQRGVHGVQADVSIRGSSFEQTLILVDGINVSDAQTGHHNLDLPINLEDIERIEVLKGPGARIYGQNAMAGVINIITREAEKTAISGYAKYGEYQYHDLGVQGAVKTAGISNRLSASTRSSDGHISDEKADFDISTFNYRGTLNRDNRTVQLGLGYTDKDFGAYRFYTDTYPNQREQTETLLAYANGRIPTQALELMPQVWWRRHDDDFKIEIDGDWYKNTHRTDTYGLQLNSQLKSALGMTALGGEMGVEDLESSNLGDHNRERHGAFFEHKLYPTEWMIFGLGTSAIHYSDWGWEYWPGAELNAELVEELHWFASVGRSFRIPTYTELYYDTPANQGNPDLKPEEAWTYETGLRWLEKYLGANVILFMRDAENIIDWVRASKEDPWQARNIAESTATGFELGLDFYPAAVLISSCVSSIHLAYTYLDSDFDTGEFESKYVLDHLRHQIHGSVILEWLDGVTQTVSARYAERVAGDSYVALDTRLAYKWHDYEAFVEVSNLFDEDYIESGFAPMPGSWVMGGVKFNLDFDT